MPLPAYPSIPYKPTLGSWQVPQWDLPPLASEMNAGTTRRRSPYTLRLSSMTFDVQMTASELATFKSFYTVDLGNGASRFTMTVWDGAAYVSRTVAFQKGSAPTFREFAYGVTSVSFAIQVENL